MASLWALLTATQAAGAFTWLTRLARGLGSDDPRSMDARRADILTALLTGQLLDNADTHLTPATARRDEPRPPTPTSRRRRGSPATTAPATTAPTTTNLSAAAGLPIHPATPGKPLIQVVIPYSTLIGADDHPAELVGIGPIPASLAREAAADSVWRRLITDSGFVDESAITRDPVSPCRHRAGRGDLLVVPSGTDLAARLPRGAPPAHVLAGSVGQVPQYVTYGSQPAGAGRA